jgi:hypothetical protein
MHHEEEHDFSMISQLSQFSTSRPTQVTEGHMVFPPSAKSYIAPTSQRKLIERKDYKALTQGSVALKITESICAKS